MVTDEAHCIENWYDMFFWSLIFNFAQEMYSLTTSYALYIFSVCPLPPGNGSSSKTSRYQNQQLLSFYECSEDHSQKPCSAKSNFKK